MPPDHPLFDPFLSTPFPSPTTPHRSNTHRSYSTALLIGEKCAVLTGEDLGYTGAALDMKVPNYHAVSEVTHLSRL